MAYVPEPFLFTDDPRVMADYLARELSKISQSFESPELSHVRLKVWHTEPDKPREGWVVRADGTDWDPGLGVGVYEYRAGAWTKLG